MAQQANRKHGLSGIGPPEASTAARVVAVVMMVATAPLIAGVAGAASADTGGADTKTEQAGTPVDIVFVFDRSASTNEDRYHMAQEVDQLATRFDDAGIDARYGLVTYNGTSRVDQPLTADFDSFEAAMHFPDGGNEEHASDAILTATSMNYREDAETVVVLVTDEDDDSSNATRAAARSSLSDVHFVAVSPSTPSESSCAVHSPPCDDRSENELRTMSAQVGGDWIDLSQSASGIVTEIATSVESRVDTETESVDTTSSATFRTIDRSANRTTVEVGDTVRFEKTVENYGTADGTYQAYLSHGGTILAEQTVSVPAGETRTITYVHQFQDPGEYDVLVTHERIATVTVTEPNEVRVNVTSPANASRLNASVTDAWTNDTVSIPTAGTNLSSPAVATIESLVVSTSAQNATPAHDVAFDVEVVATETPPNGTPPLPDHVTPDSYLSVDSTLGDDARVQFDYVASASGTTLYRYDGANTTWVALDTAAVNGTNETLRTVDSNATLYAVGVRQPALSVTDLTLEAGSVDIGDSTRVAMTVSNDGTATGTTNVTLRLDDTVVGVKEVTVTADSTRTVVFTTTPERAGTHTLGVDDGPSATLQVEATSTTTSTATATTSTSTTETTGQSSKNGSIPGFGLVVAVLALAGAALLARRRT